MSVMSDATASPSIAQQPEPAHDSLVRVGAVRFLNTLPLIYGLEQLRDLAIGCSVPSLLLDELLAGETDLALCSSIDYQRSPQPLVIIPAGVLGCCGPTLTVRLYSIGPIEALRDVYCDTDSHTSIALMQILFAERYGLTPNCVDYDAREHVAHNKPMQWPEAMLLIGDKVVTDSPPAVRYPYQLDLGELWHEMTGLPFVFATWMARRDSDPQRLRSAAAALDRQRRRNRLRMGEIVTRHAAARNWPIDLAAEYLTHRLSYTFDDAALAGLELFFEKAQQHDLIEQRRPIEVLD
jgi:chorismate dehydratase